KIKISTLYSANEKNTKLIIEDNGVGISDELLREDEHGVKKIFLENVTTKPGTPSSGYGCYIAYEIAKQRCGWAIDVENKSGGGCSFTFTIPH
ncbi:MAG: ATP-binding protein, partial [Ignavibacteria bacterium]|nr:ATP-binding protein [Ignavibacteria bacterium]